LSEIEEILQGITTPIEVSYDNGKEFNGSAFFYHEISSGSNSISNSEYWLVTNRHVILGEGVEQLPSRITFYVRRKLRDDCISWNKIDLLEDDVRRRCYIHRDGSIDVGAILITKYITKEINEAQQNNYDLIFHAISSNLSPTDSNPAEAGETLVVVGYPLKLYDNLNLFPILTLHLLSTRWGNLFNGNRCFLIDRALTDGSSGSLVITMPNRFTFDQGEIISHTEKQFLFLGIYSEVWINSHRKTGFGIVWYGDLIKEIIEERHQFTHGS
jgi:hypothetical protein